MERPGTRAPAGKKDLSIVSLNDLSRAGGANLLLLLLLLRRTGGGGGTWGAALPA